MGSYLSFDRFITPSIIRVVFMIGLAFIAAVTLGSVIYGLWTFRIFSGVILPLIGMCFVALIWRIYCEVILVFFDMRDKLAAIARRSTTP
jgi:hypothetical protein